MFDCEYETLNLPIKKDKSINSVGICNKRIDSHISKLINNYVKNNEISNTTLFLTLYGYVLSKYSNQDTIFSSIININRNSHYINNMIGMFASTQPLLLKYENNESSFLDIIKENMNILTEIQDEQNISYAELKQQQDINLKNLNN
eukprot:jgi/Orpsp1_1/1186557/evm.model.d7180000051464.1